MRGVSAVAGVPGSGETGVKGEISIIDPWRSLRAGLPVGKLPRSQVFHQGHSGRLKSAPQIRIVERERMVMPPAPSA
jgi:hypothetical protein